MYVYVISLLAGVFIVCLLASGTFIPMRASRSYETAEASSRKPAT